MQKLHCFSEGSQIGSRCTIKFVGRAFLFLRNAVVLAWTVLESLMDYRRSASDRPTRTQRANWMHRWCSTALRRLRIEVRVIGTPPESGLIVSNHLSYLDIFAFGTAMPCVFVSKAEVRQWPVFGLLTTIAGTVYVDRTRRSDTRNANAQIREVLQDGLRVVIFPEGTSSDGSGILPFYPSLFEPAVELRAPVNVACICYTLAEGDVGRDVAYWGDVTFFPHLLKLLSLRGLSATVAFSAEARVFTDRKIAASATRDEVLRLQHYSSNSATVEELR